MATDVVASSIALHEIGPVTITVNRPVGTILCLVFTDACAIAAALLIASAIRAYFTHGQPAPLSGAILAALLLCLFSLTGAGLYPGVNVNPVDELRRATSAITFAFLALLAGTFLLHDLSQSRLIYGLAYLLALFLVPLSRSLVRKLFARKSWWGSAVAIIGFGKTGKSVYETLIKNPGLGLKPIAILDDDPLQYAGADLALKAGPLSRCLEIARDHKISYGIICMPAIDKKQLFDFLDVYGQCFSHLLVIPNLIGMTSLGISAREVGGVIGLEITRQLLRPFPRLLKRSLDLLFVLAIAPLLLVLTGLFALLIKLDTGGPVLYADERIGRQGRKFRAWKLRSMVTNGTQILNAHLAAHPAAALEWHATQKLQNDPRITRIGRLMRKTSIDEIPQFWNVLVGEMSIVGPRPILEKQIGMYGPAYWLYRQVRPGITGLWQVSGRNRLSFTERAKLDKYVIQNWSVWLDIYILARTAGAVLTARGAY